MALISGGTLIRSISLFHLTLAYYFLTAPHKLVDQNLVFIFGESMGIVSLSCPFHDEFRLTIGSSPIHKPSMTLLLRLHSLLLFWPFSPLAISLLPACRMRSAITTGETRVSMIDFMN